MDFTGDKMDRLNFTGDKMDPVDCIISNDISQLITMLDSKKISTNTKYTNPKDPTVKCYPIEYSIYYLSEICFKELTERTPFGSLPKGHQRNILGLSILSTDTSRYYSHLVTHTNIDKFDMSDNHNTILHYICHHYFDAKDRSLVRWCCTDMVDEFNLNINALNKNHYTPTHLLHAAYLRKMSAEDLTEEDEDDVRRFIDRIRKMEPKEDLEVNGVKVGTIFEFHSQKR